MLRRIVLLLVAFPAAALLITLAIANRHAVKLVLDPFRPEAPVVSLMLPFYAYIFAALLAGILLGGATVWFGQGRWRRTARNRAQEAMRWQAEADRLARERDAHVAAGAGEAPRGKLLAASGR